MNRVRPRHRRRRRRRALRGALRRARGRRAAAREGAGARLDQLARAGRRRRRARRGRRRRAARRGHARAGRGLCRESAVRALTEEAPARIADLVDLGVDFDGELGLEGGHSRRRVVHAGGAETGKRDLAGARRSACAATRGSRSSRASASLELWTTDGRCVGVVTDAARSRRRATVLATGGYAALWERTTNPRRRARRGHRDGLSRRCGGRRPRVRAVPPDRARRLRLPALARRCAATARCSSTTTATASPTSSRRATSSPARSPSAGPRCSTCARSSATASRPDGHARARRLRPGARADPRRARGALHDGRHRDRPRRPHGAARPLRGRRVRLHRRARREPAGFELDARVPRLRAPRRARRAAASPLGTRPAGAACPEPERGRPVTPELRRGAVGGRRPRPDAAGLERLRRSPPPADHVWSPRARLRARRAAEATSAPTSDRGSGARGPRRPPTGQPPVLERWPEARPMRAARARARAPRARRARRGRRHRAT